jgi:GNAT superfamily N-acetyltransferase
LGHESFTADGARFVRNRTLPKVRDANWVSDISASAPDELRLLFERVDKEFAGFPYRAFEVDFRTPPLVEALLELEGYKQERGLALLLEGELNAPSARSFEIRLVDNDSAWAAYSALVDRDWREEYLAPEGLAYDAEEAAQLLETRRLRAPPVRHWLAHMDGEPRAYLSSWEGVGGIGMVEDLYTAPEYRHRGLATALLRHCVADCRARGAGPIVIGADPEDTPKQMYAAMGFRPIASTRSYWKPVNA